MKAAQLIALLTAFPHADVCMYSGDHEIELKVTEDDNGDVLYLILAGKDRKAEKNGIQK